MSLKDLTHDQLDHLADENAVADYPTSGNKDEKVAALDAAGVTAHEDAPAEAPTKTRHPQRMVVIDGVRYRREDVDRVRNKARTSRNKRRG